MFLQRYAHLIIDAVLGGYVKNIDPDALKFSVWNGKIEIDSLELQPDAFPLPPEFRLVKGTLHQLKITLPWSNLANEPISIDIQDISILVYTQNRYDQASDDKEEEQDEALKAKQMEQKIREVLKRKRATIDAIEKASQINEKNIQMIKNESWKQSFFFKLLVKILDNVQLHVQHLHLRLEDQLSNEKQPFALGLTLESIIIKSADERWNYTLVLRGTGATKKSSFLRKKMEINKFGVYWSLPLIPIPKSALESVGIFAEAMQSIWYYSFGSAGTTSTSSKQSTPSNSPSLSSSSVSSLSIARTRLYPTLYPRDYLIHPLTLSMKLTINDGQAKLPLTYDELCARVISRLGTPWMIETIDAIGDDAWEAFLDDMPKLAGDRKYTLSFVFAQAWEVARDLRAEAEGEEEEDNEKTIDGDEIPSVKQFKEALSSIFQWSLIEVDRMESSIVKYRNAVIHVIQEKSTYIDANATIDQISVCLSRNQYLSMLSLISFMTVKQRQAKYLTLRPKLTSVRQNPKVWWHYAIHAVLLDVREKLAKVDWGKLDQKRKQRQRYSDIYKVLGLGVPFESPLVSPVLKDMKKSELIIEMEKLEYEMKVQELLSLRRNARKELKNSDSKYPSIGKENHHDSPATSGIWSYASWLAGTARGTTSKGSKKIEEDPDEHEDTDTMTESSDSGGEDLEWSAQDTQKLYEAINYKPNENESPRAYPKSPSKRWSEHKPSILPDDEEEEQIWYRFRLKLVESSLQLLKTDAITSNVTPTSGSYLLTKISNAPRVNAAKGEGINGVLGPSLMKAAIDEMDIQVLIRSSSTEVDLQIRDAFLYEQESYQQEVGGGLLGVEIKTPTRPNEESKYFSLQRMKIAEVFEFHPVTIRKQMSGVRLRNCEKTLPVIHLQLEKLPVLSKRNSLIRIRSSSSTSMNNEDPQDVQSRYRVGLVTQPLKCNVNLPFLLKVGNFFTRPAHVDLSNLQGTAWKKAQSLQHYSAAQLRDAISRRTIIDISMDVIAPVINIAQVSPSSEAAATISMISDVKQSKSSNAPKPVSVLVFLGHLTATSKHHDDDTSLINRNALVKEPTDRDHLIYDILEFVISGIEVQVHEGILVSLNSSMDTVRYHLLEKTSVSFCFHTSVAPEDHTIPLVKLEGGFDRIKLNFSLASYRALLRLIKSFDDNMKHQQEELEVFNVVEDVVNKYKTPLMLPQTRSENERSSVHSSSAVGMSNRSKHTRAHDVNQSTSDRYSLDDSPGQITKPPRAFSDQTVEEILEAAHKKEIDDCDLIKLWKRVHGLVHFVVGQVVINLELPYIREKHSSSPYHGRIMRVITTLSDFTTRFQMRTYDRRLEVRLGSIIVVEQTTMPDKIEITKRVLLTSVVEKNDSKEARSFDQGSLVQVAITSVVPDAVKLKDKRLYEEIAFEDNDFSFGLCHNNEQSSKKGDILWKDVLLTPLSLDVCLDTLTLNFYQDTFSQLFLFFTRSGEDGSKKMPHGNMEPNHHQKNSIAVEDSTSMPGVGSTQLSKRISNWVTSSFLENLPLKHASATPKSNTGGSLSQGRDLDLSRSYSGIKSTSHSYDKKGSSSTEIPVNEVKREEEKEDQHQAGLQLRLRVRRLALILYASNDMLESSRKEKVGDPLAVFMFAGLSADEFYLCAQKFPRCLRAFAYLTSLKLSDLTVQKKHLQEILSHVNHSPSTSSAQDKVSAKGREKASHSERSDIIDESEILKICDEVPAMFAIGAHLYGADQIQEAWHPGYCNRFDLRLKSPRIRFFLRFFNDLQNYFFCGVLWNTIQKELFPEQIQMHWEGDFRLSTLSEGSAPMVNGTPAGTPRGRDVSFVSLAGSVINSPRWVSSPKHAAIVAKRKRSNPDVVSTFPLLDIQLLDAVIEMPPHRTSEEALLLRFNRLRLSNEYLLTISIKPPVRLSTNANEILAKVLLNSSLIQLRLDLETLRIVSKIWMTDPKTGDYKEQSLIGSTDINLTIDHNGSMTASDLPKKMGDPDSTYHGSVIGPNMLGKPCLKVEMKTTPIRFVCNQEQYAFVLYAPLANLQEETQYDFSGSIYNENHEKIRALPPPSSQNTLKPKRARTESAMTSSSTPKSPTSVSIIEEESDAEEEEQRRMMWVHVTFPEVSIELLHGQHGYQPSSSGDISIAQHAAGSPVSSMCFLEIVDFNIDYLQCSSMIMEGQNEMALEFYLESFQLHDVRRDSSNRMSDTFRKTVVLKQAGDVDSDRTHEKEKKKVLHVKLEKIYSDEEEAKLLSERRMQRSMQEGGNRGQNTNVIGETGVFNGSFVDSTKNHEAKAEDNEEQSEHRESFASNASSYNSSRSQSYRSEEKGVYDDESHVEECWDIVIEVFSFQLIPSNLHYDLVKFLQLPLRDKQDLDQFTDEEPDEDNEMCEKDEENLANTSETPGGHEGSEQNEVHIQKVDPALSNSTTIFNRRYSLHLSLGPTGILFVEDPTRSKSRSLMLSWEAKLIASYAQGSIDATSVGISAIKDRVLLHLQLQNIHATSRLSQQENHLFDKIQEELIGSNGVNSNSSSGTAGKKKVPRTAAGDCLKLINMESALRGDLRTNCWNFQLIFDRVMELRFGYLDFCTMQASLENIMYLPSEKTSIEDVGADEISRLHRSSSAIRASDRRRGESLSSGSFGSQYPNTGFSQSITWGGARFEPLVYGTSTIQLLTASASAVSPFYGNRRIVPAVAYYNPPWRMGISNPKRYLVLPSQQDVTAASASSKNYLHVAKFRILPVPGKSRRKIGDRVYYGDSVYLECVEEPQSRQSNSNSNLASSSSRKKAPATIPTSKPICKYDQLGATGYLGPEGTAGTFETVIWKHGSSLFNSDRSVIYSRDTILLEGITLYQTFKYDRSNNSGNAGLSTSNDAELSAAFTSAAVPILDDRGVSNRSGYLMFNGVGDAPIPFSLWILSDITRTLDTNEKDTVVTEETDGGERKKKVKKKRRKSRQSENSRRTNFKEKNTPPFFINLKSIDIRLPGVNATIVNDFNNMLLPLLHFRVAMLHAIIRGYLPTENFTCIWDLRFGIQAYNSQLAVWEPLVEDFDVDIAFHRRGGVICDACMSQVANLSARSNAPPPEYTIHSGQPDRIPVCLFQPGRTAVFAQASARANESKHFIHRELLQQSSEKEPSLAATVGLGPADRECDINDADTFLLVIKKDLNVNVSRNNLNVLMHFIGLFSTTEEKQRLSMKRLGPYIYVDNQTGIPFLIATHVASSVPTLPGVVVTEADGPISTSELETHNISPSSSLLNQRRPPVLNNDVLNGNTIEWNFVGVGDRVATDIVAHEAPAGSVTSPLRRVLWLKPSTAESGNEGPPSGPAAVEPAKAVPVPIGYSNRSYLHLEAVPSSSRSSTSEQQLKSWHGKTVICETVAEQGTLVLRLRSKIQFVNHFPIPIQLVYNEDAQNNTYIIEPNATRAHYVPLEFIEENGLTTSGIGSSDVVSFCPLLENGKVQRSIPIPLASLVAKQHADGVNMIRGSFESRRVLSFYWDLLPSHEEEDEKNSSSKPPKSKSTFMSLPPFQVILTSTRKSEQHETLITLRPLIVLENLLPYEIRFRTVCLNADEEMVLSTLEKTMEITDLIPKRGGTLSGRDGKVQSGSSLSIAECEIDQRDGKTPFTVALSICLKEIGFETYSHIDQTTLIHGGRLAQYQAQAQRQPYGKRKSVPTANTGLIFCERIELCDGDKNLLIRTEVQYLEKLHSVSFNVVAPVICRVFCEYWLIDRTDLSLAFVTNDSILSSHQRRVKKNKVTILENGELDPPLTLYSFGSASNRRRSTKISSPSSHKLGVLMLCPNNDLTTQEQKGQEEQEQMITLRSEMFDVSVVGVRGQIFVPEATSSQVGVKRVSLPGFSEETTYISKKQFEFGVRIDQAPGKFSRSKMVTFLPRYYFMNSSKRFVIQVRQEGSLNKDSWLELKPQETRSFHWPRANLSSRVQIRFIEVNGDIISESAWSSPFEISSVGDFAIRLRKIYARSSSDVFSSKFCLDIRQKLTGYPRSSVSSDRLKLHVVIELHDPSFFISLHEGMDEEIKSVSGISPNTAQPSSSTSYIPFKIRNECSTLELVAWQKATVADQSVLSNCFEGTERVLPFKEIEYVPYMYSASPTLWIQVRRLVALDKQSPQQALVPGSGSFNAFDFAEEIEYEALGTFEVTLDKPHHLPSYEFRSPSRSNNKKYRIWSEVVMDGTTKTLVVTDHLPGATDEHKRRRRISLLRSWKTYHQTVVSMNYLLREWNTLINTIMPVTNDNPDGEGDHLKQKKRVHFAPISGVDSNRSQSSDSDIDNDSDKELIGYAVTVRLAGAINLNVMYREQGKDFTHAKPFVQGELRSLQPVSNEKEKSSKKNITASTIAVEKHPSEFVKYQREDKTTLYPQQMAIFPQWLPSTTSPSGGSLLTAFVPANKEVEQVKLNVQVRERAGIIFGSSILASFEVDLLPHLTQNSNTYYNSEELRVNDLLCPLSRDAAAIIDLSKQLHADASREMLRLQVCFRKIRIPKHTDAGLSSENYEALSAQVNEVTSLAFEQVKQSMEAFIIEKELRRLVQSKSNLKRLLEQESIDISTTSGSSITPEEKEESSSSEMLSQSSGPPSDTQEVTEELIKKLTAVVINVSNLKIPREYLEQQSKEASANMQASICGGLDAKSTDKHTSDDHKAGPKVYCTLSYQESTRSAMSAVAKHSNREPWNIFHENPATLDTSTNVSKEEGENGIDEEQGGSNAMQVRTLEFPAGETLGLDLVYRKGRVIVQGVACNQYCGVLVFQKKIFIGDSIIAVNGKSIVNLHQEACFNAIENARLANARPFGAETNPAARATSSFTLSFIYQQEESLHHHQAVVSDPSFLYKQKRIKKPKHGSKKTIPPFGSSSSDNFETFDAEWNRRVEFLEMNTFVSNAEQESKQTSTEDHSGNTAETSNSGVCAPSSSMTISSAISTSSRSKTKSPLIGKKRPGFVVVRVFLRNETSDHGLSTLQESSVVPFLYFFGDDDMMDHLDHSKQDTRFDVIVAECWVPLPLLEDTSATERLCALYAPRKAGLQSSSTSFEDTGMEMVGQLRLALKWDYLDPSQLVKPREHLLTYFQLEMSKICVSIVDDGSVGTSATSSTIGSSSIPREVLCISISDQHASSGVQLSYGLLSDSRQVMNLRLGHFQIDNQLLETNYPVLLRPVRLVENQQMNSGFGGGLNGPSPDGTSASSGSQEAVDTIDLEEKQAEDRASLLLLPTFQLMAVFSKSSQVIEFEYIFAQLQELEIKLEDSTLVALAQAFTGVQWSVMEDISSASTSGCISSGTASSGPLSNKSNFAPNPLKIASGRSFGGRHANRNQAFELLHRMALEEALLTPKVDADDKFHDGSMSSKVLLRWLLLCRIKINVTFSSTTDRSLLLNILSPEMSSVLRSLIGAAAALVSNLDRAPLTIPEFYVENLFETKHTLAFYVMQHYIHHGLRSWYKIVGSVDFLGNPIGLVSALGTGVKDFFYTPAQMLLEDENGLRIENLRTGMTKGSKSLLRNTAVGIFHTTGKITETLGKGIAILAMDEQYNVERQRRSLKQSGLINDLGDGLAEGSKGLIGGVWEGLKGVVTAPVRGAEQDGAGGFVLGIGKGFAGLIVKPTAGFLDLLTSLSKGAKTSAETIDGANLNTTRGITRYRLPRRICMDGVLVSYSEREARGNAILLLCGLDSLDEYIYHVDYGLTNVFHLRGLVMLTDKRILCLSAKNGQRLWEIALDSTVQIEVAGVLMKLSQGKTSNRVYNIECDNEFVAYNFKIAVDAARLGDVFSTRYLLLNLEKNQEEAKSRQNEEQNTANDDLQMNLLLMKNDSANVSTNVSANATANAAAVLVAAAAAGKNQDVLLAGFLSADDLAAQPLRSVRVELCHLENKDAHANVPPRAIDKVLNFSVFHIQVYGGPYQWTVYRRFSEFKKLSKELEQEGFDLELLPTMPSRTFLLPSTRASVARYRQEALSVFLQAAIMHSAISRHQVMLDFLTRQAQEIRVSLPSQSPIFSSATNGILNLGGEKEMTSLTQGGERKTRRKRDGW